MVQQPLTSQWDSRNGKGYAYNTDTSLVPFARTVTGDAPDQITITYQVIPDDNALTRPFSIGMLASKMLFPLGMLRCDA